MNNMYLCSSRVDAYLERLGNPQISHTLEGLIALQKAHLQAIPFHNLLLLKNNGAPYALPSLESVVDDAIQGIGGNCDRTNPPFCALLQSLGFRAYLASATVYQEGDHFVCIVHVGSNRYLCDVGNGHPYFIPWNLDGEVQQQSHLGWHFVFDPHDPCGPTLKRVMGESQKVVYRIQTQMRSYDSFTTIVEHHYTKVGYGPFMRGLRSVRFQEEMMHTLRDCTYRRYTDVCTDKRHVVSLESAQKLLEGRFGYPKNLVREGLQQLQIHRPNIFTSPSWVSLGKGFVSYTQSQSRPKKEEVPDILISLATIGRVQSVQRLLRSIDQEVQESQYHGNVGVLILENHEPMNKKKEKYTHINVEYVPILRAYGHLERIHDLGLLPKIEKELPLSIGAAREAQLYLLWKHFQHPNVNLPHPEQHPTLVWMVDDDVAFCQLDDSQSHARQTNLLFRAARYWIEHPECSVVMGSFVGDPPIPGTDALLGQVHDIHENLKQMCALPESEYWKSRLEPEGYVDAYYDLSEQKTHEEDIFWPYVAQENEFVHGAIHRLLNDIEGLHSGCLLTRKLMWNGEERWISDSVRRGGNALFLDWSALFRWPTPVLACEDGIITRRGDTIWATLAQQDKPGLIVEAALPLLHGREEQYDNSSITPSKEQQKVSAQIRGTVLARGIGKPFSIGFVLEEREKRVEKHRDRCVQKITCLQELILSLSVLGDEERERHIQKAHDSLERLKTKIHSSRPIKGDPKELEQFVSHIQASIPMWREVWK